MAQKRAKADALDKGLKSMFRALEARPLPDRLRSIVDQLDEGQPKPRQDRKSA